MCFGMPRPLDRGVPAPSAMVLCGGNGDVRWPFLPRQRDLHRNVYNRRTPDREQRVINCEDASCWRDCAGFVRGAVCGAIRGGRLACSAATLQGASIRSHGPYCCSAVARSCSAVCAVRFRSAVPLFKDSPSLASSLLSLAPSLVAMASVGNLRRTPHTFSRRIGARWACEDKKRTCWCTGLAAQPCPARTSCSAILA